MAEIVVTTRLDVVDAGDGQTSLREAVAQATHQGDVIKFDHAVLLGANSGVVYLESALNIADGQNLAIDGDIDGDGVGDVTLSNGAPLDVVLDALVKVEAGAAATLENLTFKGSSDYSDHTVGASGQDGTTGAFGGNGESAGSSGGDGGAGTSGFNANSIAAGGVYNEGSLTLRDVSFVQLAALGGGGGTGGSGGLGGTGVGDNTQPEGIPEIGGNGGAGGHAGSGGDGGKAVGAIYNSGTLRIEGDVVLALNKAVGGNGGSGGFGGLGGDGAPGNDSNDHVRGGHGVNGDGGNGGNGGAGGDAVGALLNEGSIVIAGVLVVGGNISVGGSGGPGASGGGGGTDSTGFGTVPPGESGLDGLSGIDGDDLGEVHGSVTGTLEGTAAVSVTAVKTEIVEATDIPNSPLEAPETTVTFRFVRVGDLSGAATVNWSVFLDANDESIVDLSDFELGTQLTGTINFTAGQALVTLELKISHDTDGEDDETLRLQLSTPSDDLALGAHAQAEVTVGNDDGTPEPDTLTGRSDFFNYITGLQGNDDLTGGAASDKLFGNEGNDTLNGLASIDRLDGGADNDTLNGGADNDFLIGGAGNDTLNGGGGDDTVDYVNAPVGLTVTLPGGGGSFTVTGEGTDTLSSIERVIGSKFADKLTGNSGMNILSGSGGNDTIEGGAGADFLSGGDGIDLLSYANATAAVVVTLAAPNGSSTTSGGAGSDSISDFENVEGSNFNDTLTGNAIANLLRGGKGNDTLDGAGGADTADYSKATSAVTVRLGTAADAAGNGASSGADGIDVLKNMEAAFGSAFADTLTGNKLDNLLQGDNGDDVLKGGLGTNVLDGGSGNDTASYDWTSKGVTVLLKGIGGGLHAIERNGNPTFKDGFATAAGVSKIENVRGSNGNDLVRGDDAANKIEGLAGDDTLSGGGGNDRLDGGANRSGGDLVAETLGGDWVDYSGATVAMTIDLNSGVGLGQGTDTLVALEHVHGSSTRANTITGNSAANNLRGGNGADLMSGGAGNDYITGLNGADDLRGGDGNDFLRKATGHAYPFHEADTPIAVIGQGTGNSTFRGDDGNDRIYTGKGSDQAFGGDDHDVIYASRGNDRYDGGAGVDGVDFAESASGLTAGVTANLATGVATSGSGASLVRFNLVAIEVLVGTKFDDKFTGGTGANSLDGQAGDDVLDGGGGADVLMGGEGDDTFTYRSGSSIRESAGQGHDLVRSSLSHTLGANVEDLTLEGGSGVNGTGNGLNNVLTGNKGANVLSGGDGSDTLIGKAGADTLAGGKGNDFFVFDAPLLSTNQDKIADLSNVSGNNDTIRLDNVVMTKLGAGPLKAANFVAGAAAQGADDFIVYNKATGTLTYDSNGNAAGGATVLAVLTNKPTLAVTDFTVI